MARPREHGDKTRALLLDAAARRLRDDGAEALSLRRLADDADTTTRAIYALFGSKEGLLRALYRSGFEALHRRQADVVVTGDPITDVVALARAYRATAVENPHMYSLMFDGVAEFRPTADDRDFARRTLRQVRDAVRAAAAARRLPDDTRMITLQIWALVHGLASLELQGILGDTQTAERYWTDAVAALMRGHAPSTASSHG